MLMKIIRWVTFIVLLLISTSLGIILYTGLAHDELSKIVMIACALTVEGLAVVSLTSAKTSAWQATTLKQWFIVDAIRGFFKPWNRGKITDGNLLKAVNSYRKHIRLSVVMYIVYIFTAILSITNSYGYISSTVYIATRGKEVVSTLDTQIIYKDQLASCTDIIAQDRRLIKGYEAEIAKLDILLSDIEIDEIKQQEYLNQKDQYQRRINVNNKEISDKLAEKAVINIRILTLKNQEISNNKTFGKSSYLLMGEQFGVSESTVMFILLYLLAIMIQVGILVTSPISHKMDTEDSEIHVIVEKPKVMESPPKKEAEPVIEIVAENSPILVPVNLHQTKKTILPITLVEEVEEYHPEPVLDASLTIPVTIEEGVKEEESEEPAAAIEVVIPIALEPPKEPESEPEPVVIPKPGVIVMPDPVIVAPEPPIPEPVVVVNTRTINKSKLIDNYIDNLFDVKGKMRLREEVAREVGLPLIHAIKITDFLTHEKGYLKFIPSMGWYLITTLEYIKLAIGKLYG